VSEAAGARRTEEFATLLRELKDRSGLSYGVLAKRLHTSTSTLHRYCNGTAVPGEYAPIERLARVCRATPRELMELHRRWILADAARGLKGEQAPVAAEEAAAAVVPDTAVDDDTTIGPVPDPASDTSRDTSPDQSPDQGDAPRPEDPVLLGPPHAPAPAPRHHRRTTLIAATAAAAVLALGATALVAHPWSGTGGTDDARDQQAVGASANSGPDGAQRPAVPSASGQRRTPSASASAPRTPGSGASGAVPSGKASGNPSGTTTAKSPVNSGRTNGVPLTVHTRPYVYASPCSQHFLVNSAPAQVGPAASEQDAPRWAAAYGAVSSDEERIGLTVQGTGADTVILEALHVRVLTKDVPLAWNDYSMGVGCGGAVDTKAFDIDLDDGSPTVTVKGGQRDFPYQVSESDPEVFTVIAHTKAHDVRWDLTLDWSSGGRHGTVHIDNGGDPFRTSADVGRPGYDYPLGSGDWISRVDG
jgi:transcriptional regulator with XRE-family HTH domain